MPTHDLDVKILTLENEETVDITGIALEKSGAFRHNVMSGVTVEVPSGHALVTQELDDGYPALATGLRKLYLERDGEPIFHGRIRHIERSGDGNTNRAKITAFDPQMELGYESEDSAGRPVRDETGNFIDPSFDSPISGAQLLYEILTNSQQVGDESDPTPGEGPLPILLDPDNFDSTDDMSPDNTMSWPVMIGDFIQQLVDTNLLDVRFAPLKPEDAVDPYHMVELFVSDLIGTDKSGTVHFDYWTGSFNASNCREVEDFGTVNNKLYDYLGPRLGQRRWAGNITPGSPGTTVDPTASRGRYGTFMQIRAFDSNRVENTLRPLFLNLWNAEQGLRLEPRKTLFLTPNPDADAVFEPWTNYSFGDLIAVNTGAPFGVAVAGIQRVYGWDVTWTRLGTERVTNLIVQADAA